MDQLFILATAATFATLFMKKQTLAYGIYTALLPTYLLRTQFGPLPTTLLELLTIVLIIGVVIRERKTLTKHVHLFVTKHYTLAIAITLFLLGATIGVFASTNVRAALGEWRAFYVEPVLVFFAIVFAAKDKKNRQAIIAGLLASAFVTSLLTLIQKPTGWLVPWAFWENGDSYRVTGWWGFPNGVGAFQAPLTVLWLYPIVHELSGKKRTGRIILLVIGFLLSLFSLIFAKSTGGMIGVLAGIGAMLICWKKTRLPALTLGIAGILVLIAMPSNPVKAELLAQDRSGQIRVQMWGEALELIKARPFTGAGMASYQDRVVPYHTLVNGERIEIFHHPHNTLLTVWVNTGLLGVIGFAWVIVWMLRVLIIRIWTKDASAKDSILLAAPIIATLIHGLVDSPYIKNDTSVLFWLMLALFLLAKPTTRSSHFELVE